MRPSSSPPTSSWKTSSVTRVPTPAAEGHVLPDPPRGATVGAAPRRRRRRAPGRASSSVGSRPRRKVTGPTPRSRQCTTTPEGFGSGPSSSRSWPRPSPSAPAVRVAGRVRPGRSAPASDRCWPAMLDLEPGRRAHRRRHRHRSGIGAIFGAPLGGAVLAAEILYRDDFDAGRATARASSPPWVGYVIFGRRRLHAAVRLRRSYHFTDPSQLVWFALIGVLGGLVGLLYAKGFYGIADAVRRGCRCPRWVKPAIGGLLVGGIGSGHPRSARHRLRLDPSRDSGPHCSRMPLWIVLILPFARILATGLSIGSGGSGGIFGPGMVIGAFVGAAVWRLFEPSSPPWATARALRDRRDDVLLRRDLPRAVGGDAHGRRDDREPVHPRPRPWWRSVSSWLIVRRNDDTMYRSQLKSRADAPAQRILAGLPLLGAIATTRAMVTPRLLHPLGHARARAKRALEHANLNGAPVVDGAKRFTGTVARSTLASAECGSKRSDRTGRCRGASRFCIESARCGPREFDGSTTVLGPRARRRPPRRRHTFPSRTSCAYRAELLASAQRVSALGAATGAVELAVTERSGLAGHALRAADLPDGTLVTSIRAMVRS